MKTALVTGGAGFIGSHVAQRLLESGHRVIIVDDLSGGTTANLPHGGEFVRADCGHQRSMDELFRRVRPEAVYHLAAYAAEGLSPFIRRYNAYANGVCSANMLSLALKYEVPKYVFTSSMAVYGQAPTPFREDQAGLPVDPYGAYKYAAELDIMAAQATHGLDYTIWRPHNVFGPHQNINDPYRNVVGIFMKAALENKPMRIFGDGSQIRAFSFIDDMAATIAESGWNPSFRNTTLNIGSDHPRTVVSLANHIREVSGTRLAPEFVPARHEVHVAYASHQRLGFLKSVPETDFVDGLSRMWQWVQTQKNLKPTPLPCEIEVTRGLPESWTAFNT